MGISRVNRAEMPEFPGRMGKLGLEFVVGMQHCGRTSSGSLETPKKAAVAWVFCFTRMASPITLMPRNEFAQSINACLSDLRQSD